LIRRDSLNWELPHQGLGVYPALNLSVYHRFLMIDSP